MTETFQAPTDNLYKFLAIGGLAFALLSTYYLFREQARLREIWTDAQVVLIANGYEEGSGVPKDKELALAYARREFAHQQGKELIGPTAKLAANVIYISLSISVAGFVLWWFRVQRYDDAILVAAATAKAIKD